MGCLRQRSEQVRLRLRGVVQPRTGGREQQREADVVGELGPDSDPTRIRGDRQPAAPARRSRSRGPTGRRRSRPRPGPGRGGRRLRRARSAAAGSGEPGRGRARPRSAPRPRRRRVRRRGTRARSSVRADVGAGLPVQRSREPDTAVELAVRTVQGVPGVGRAAEVVPDALALDVVVEPAAQPGPGAGQRLVGDLEDPLVAGDEPRVDEQLDQLLVVGVRARSVGAGPGCAPLRRRCRARPAAGRGRAAGAARRRSTLP